MNDSEMKDEPAPARVSVSSASTAAPVAMRIGVAGAALAGFFALLSIPTVLLFSPPWRGLDDHVANAGDLHLTTYALWWLVSLAFLATTVALHATAAARERPLTLLALVLAVPYATLASINYVLQMTFVRHAIRAGDTEGLATWIVGNPSSALFALDILGYFFLSLATLVAAFTFRAGPHARALRALYLAHGATGMIGFASVFVPPSTWEGDSIFATLILVAWPLLFGPMMLTTMYWFRRRFGTADVEREAKLPVTGL